MTFRRLILRSAAYYWRTNLAVVLGVAAAVSVLAGALLVGDSVRGSLRDIAIGRLGKADHVVSSVGFFREALADDLRKGLPGASVTPLVVATGFVTHEVSGRRAAGVLVYGVDERFWAFHGQPAPGGPDEIRPQPHRSAADGVMMSPALARELGITAGDTLLVRLQKPSEIPIESLFGRKDEIGRTVRLTAAGELPRERLGEFALRPQQAEVRALFAPLSRIQRDLAVGGQVNTLLVAGAEDRAVDAAVRSALTLEDLGVKLSPAADPPAVAVESLSGVLGEPLEAAALEAGETLGLRPLPVFTYLANSIRKGDRQIPYSLITATDLAALPVRHAPAASSPAASSPAPSSATPSSAAPSSAAGEDSIVLNEWATRDLEATRGDRIEVDYFLWDANGGLTTHTASFTLGGVVPIAGLAADRRLAPEYPGITGASTLADWDPPFPLDLSRVRPRDEQYWKDHRATPKAFIPFERGRALWRTRYGGATSIRFIVPPGAGPSAVAERMNRELRDSLDPRAAGVTVSPARRLALEASAGATDFGEYFTYFSFFLVVSALLLAVLFFRLGVEQRLLQIGIMRAAGFTIAHVRRLLLTEAVVLATAGSVMGIGGAMLYGWLIVYGLRTWWIGAVGTALLQLHVSWISLAAGAAAGIVASALCVILSLRAVARFSPRALLSAQSIDGGAVVGGNVRRSRAIAVALCSAAGVMLAAGFVRRDLQSGMFFGAGAALLAACMFMMSASLRSRNARPVSGRGAWAVARLGFRSAASRPSRSVLSAALIASAAFIIVSVDAFRRGTPDVDAGQHSGTGGYVLMAESQLPLLHNPNEPSGREALMVQGEVLARARFTRFRVRPGEDTSCLNLYRPTNPTIVAPEAGFIESGRFAFAASMAETDAERANPWLLLRRPTDDGVIPVVADATSLQYVLHARIGDTFTIQTGDAPLTLRFVGTLADSVLQGELVMSEEHFVRLFPAQQGYRFFLIDAPGVRTAAQAESIAGALERELGSFGFDAVTTADRLAAFHRVENTYLSTFQALGGLGLLLGTIGLAAIMFRNVLERRRELALLRAVGYDARRVSILIMAEAALLLGAGLAAGVGSAVVAVAPAWLGRHGTLPGAGLAALLLGVVLAALVSSFVATRAALSGNMLEALRAE